MENLGVKYLKAIYRKHGERISDPVIKEVLDNLKNGKLMRSEYQNRMFRAVLYFLTDEEKEKVKEIEQEYKCTICHVILRHTEDAGKEYIYMMVPDTEEFMKESITNGWYRSVVSNNYDTDCGDVGVRPAMGGFERIW